VKHLHFFIGKGGVGKTTLAALYALYLARQNKPVHLISLDPAHNIYDVFKSHSVPGIQIEEIDLNKWLKNYIKRVEESINRSYRYFTAFNLEKNIKVLRHAPAVEEYALLLSFQDIMRKSADGAYLLFDMPPTALALRFFNLPSLSLVWIDNLIKLRSEIVKKREMITKIKLGKQKYESDKILAELSRQKKAYDDVMKLFRNTECTIIQIVANPDHLSLSETKQIIQTLEEQKLPIRRIIMNKVPDNSVSSALKAEFANYEVCFLPLSEYELNGKKNLDKYLNENYTYLGY